MASVCLYRLLLWIWPGECGVGDRILIMNYAGTELARSLTWRQRIVCALVHQHCKRMARLTVD
jgi:hypothetical protein